MTEMQEKKGKLKMTIEVEVNEELMDLAKDAMEKMPMRMQEMWKMHGGAKRKSKLANPRICQVSFISLFLKTKILPI